MKYTTTLAALREHNACVSGYNKLACALAGQKFDADAVDRIKCDHSDPITLSYILNSNCLDDALWALRAVEKTPEFVRKCRLYAVWCARQVQHLKVDSRSIAALDVAERHANGQATDAELAAAAEDAAACADAACLAAWSSASTAWDLARVAGGDDDAWDLARAAQRAKFVEMFIEGEYK